MLGFNSEFGAMFRLLISVAVLPTTFSTNNCRLNYYFPVSRATEPPLNAEAC